MKPARLFMTMERPRVIMNMLKWGARMAGRMTSRSTMIPKRAEIIKVSTMARGRDKPIKLKKVNPTKADTMDISPWAKFTCSVVLYIKAKPSATRA